MGARLGQNASLPHATGLTTTPRLLEKRSNRIASCPKKVITRITPPPKGTQESTWNSPEITGTVWKIVVEVREEVEEEDELVILESMKMPVESTADGVVKEIRIK